MVFLTRKQLEKLNKEELIDELLTVNSFHEELASLTSRSDEFPDKYALVQSELDVSKNSAKLLSKQTETLKLFKLYISRLFLQQTLNMVS